jgi:hypothetical protein
VHLLSEANTSAAWVPASVQSFAALGKAWKGASSAAATRAGGILYLHHQKSKKGKRRNTLSNDPSQPLRRALPTVRDLSLASARGLPGLARYKDHVVALHDDPRSRHAHWLCDDAAVDEVVVHNSLVYCGVQPQPRARQVAADHAERENLLAVEERFPASFGLCGAAQLLNMWSRRILLFFSLTCSLQRPLKPDQVLGLEVKEHAREVISEKLDGVDQR